MKKVLPLHPLQGCYTFLYIVGRCMLYPRHTTNSKFNQLFVFEQLRNKCFLSMTKLKNCGTRLPCQKCLYFWQYFLFFQMGQRNCAGFVRLELLYTHGIKTEST